MGRGAGRPLARGRDPRPLPRRARAGRGGDAGDRPGGGPASRPVAGGVPRGRCRHCRARGLPRGEHSGGPPSPGGAVPGRARAHRRVPVRPRGDGGGPLRRSRHSAGPGGGRGPAAGRVGRGRRGGGPRRRSPGGAGTASPVRGGRRTGAGGGGAGARGPGVPPRRLVPRRPRASARRTGRSGSRSPGRLAAGGRRKLATSPAASRSARAYGEGRRAAVAEQASISFRSARWWFRVGGWVTAR